MGDYQLPPRRPLSKEIDPEAKPNVQPDPQATSTGVHGFK